MSVTCEHCHRILAFSGDPPRFCAYCGQRLGTGDPAGLVALLGAPLTPGSLEETTEFVGPRPIAAAAGPPERIDAYRILGELGSGGMGTVYEAEDERSGRRVALKLIAAEYLRSRDALERFRQEGRLASTLEHPRCVYVLAADEDEHGRPYIVMERMPGQTLQSLVEGRGPLPVEEAVAKILDVIEGLRQAHAQGVVHRDVKPSNCFLDADGRVKVGDFGLAKSLDRQAGLTRTGSFIGTPLYASPEQIKGDAVDGQSDLYSVAATLYFLLTGTPPFAGKDAAATLARIVSEPPVPPRELRRDLPPTLEALVLRGLDRDRDRRWASLADLQQALLPFLRSRQTVAGLVARVLAFGLDIALYAAALAVVVGLGRLAVWSIWPTDSQRGGPFLPPPLLNMLENLGFVLYFGLFEGLTGASPGKRLCGLRVVDPAGGTPGLRRALSRSFLFFLCTGFVLHTIELLLGPVGPPIPGFEQGIRRVLALGTTTLLGLGISAVLIGSTMRGSNGYRGLHEVASGTQVLRKLRNWRRRSVPIADRLRPSTMSTPRPSEIPEELDGFRIEGAIRWEPGCRVLHGEDPALGRPVWIVLRSTDQSGPAQGRQELARRSRPRWLTSGTLGPDSWDAYSAPMGCSISELAGATGLAWREVLPLLDDLTEELATGLGDGTLPEGLDVDQVWVQPDGHILLVDALLPAGRMTDAPGSAEPRALALLAAVAARALDGRRASDRGRPGSIQRPLPVPVARWLDRLQSAPSGPARAPRLATMRQELRQLHAAPTELGRGRRAMHLLLQAALLTPGLATLFLWSPLSQGSNPLAATDAGQWSRWLLGLAAAWPLAWILWGGCTRGGLTLKLAGIALVGHHNSLVSRPRAALRAALLWVPFTLIVLGLPILLPAWRGTIWWAGLALLPTAAIVALIDPARPPHDRALGTTLVPR